MVGFEREAERLIQRDMRRAIGDQGGNFGSLRAGQIALGLHYVIRRRCSQVEFLLFGVQKLLVQNAVADGGVVAGAGLF